MAYCEKNRKRGNIRTSVSLDFGEAQILLAAAEKAFKEEKECPQMHLRVLEPGVMPEVGDEVYLKFEVVAARNEVYRFEYKDPNGGSMDIPFFKEDLANVLTSSGNKKEYKERWGAKSE